MNLKFGKVSGRGGRGGDRETNVFVGNTKKNPDEIQEFCFLCMTYYFFTPLRYQFRDCGDHFKVAGLLQTKVKVSV